MSHRSTKTCVRCEHSRYLIERSKPIRDQPSGFKSTTQFHVWFFYSTCTSCCCKSNSWAVSWCRLIVSDYCESFQILVVEQQSRINWRMFELLTLRDCTKSVRCTVFWSLPACPLRTYHSLSLSSPSLTPLILCLHVLVSDRWCPTARWHVKRIDYTVLLAVHCILHVSAATAAVEWMCTSFDLVLHLVLMRHSASRFSHHAQ